MTPKEFDEMIEPAFLQLPEWIRKKIENVALLVEDEPSEDDREAQGLEEDETLLGLYKGIPLSERGDMYGVGMTLPDTITLYREPILDEADHETPQEAPYEDFKSSVARVITETILARIRPSFRYG